MKQNAATAHGLAGAQLGQRSHGGRVGGRGRRNGGLQGEALGVAGQHIEGGKARRDLDAKLGGALVDVALGELAHLPVHLEQQLLGLRREQDRLHALGRVSRLDERLHLTPPHLVLLRRHPATAALAAVAGHVGAGSDALRDRHGSSAHEQRRGAAEHGEG